MTKRYKVVIKDSRGTIYSGGSYRWKSTARRKVRKYGSFAIAFDDVTGKWI